MTRLTDTDNSTAAEQPHVAYVLFGDFDFVSGHVRVSSWNKSFTFGGNTYDGLGGFVDVGDITEEGGTTSQKLEFTLSGIPDSVVSIVLAEKYHGRAATLYLGFLDANEQLVSNPEIIWEGLMDVMTLKCEQNSSLVSLVCENRLVRWKDKINLSYTDEHQRRIDATDEFFALVDTLANKSVIWGGVEGQYQQSKDGSWS